VEGFGFGTDGLARPVPSADENGHAETGSGPQGESDDRRKPEMPPHERDCARAPPSTASIAERARSECSARPNSFAYTVIVMLGFACPSCRDT
jgi:hypothetical protein